MAQEFKMLGKKILLLVFVVLQNCTLFSEKEPEELTRHISVKRSS